MTYEEYYIQIGMDTPSLDEKQRRIHALQASRMDAWIVERKRIGPVRLVPQESSFVHALFGAVETTGRMPVVRPKEEEQEAG